MELDIVGLLDELEAVLRNDAGITDEPRIEVTQELDLPLADQCPIVVLAVGNVSFDTLLIGNLDPNAMTDWAKVELYLAITAMSAESAKDAARQRDDVCRRVLAAFRKSRNAGGLVRYVLRKEVTMEWRSEEAGIFASAIIRCEAGALV